MDDSLISLLVGLQRVKIEARVDKFLIDVIKEDILIEIQTQNFSAIKEKLATLINTHKVLLVHPIIRDKWILKFDIKSKRILKKTLSPKHDNYLNIFEELIRIPYLISNPNLPNVKKLVGLAESRIIIREKQRSYYM